MSKSIHLDKCNLLSWSSFIGRTEIFPDFPKYAQLAAEGAAICLRLAPVSKQKMKFTDFAPAFYLG